MQIIFLSGKKYLRLPQYVNNFLVWHKTFGPAQNILGPVKGQGISFSDIRKRAHQKVKTRQTRRSHNLLPYFDEK